MRKPLFVKPIAGRPRDLQTSIRHLRPQRTAMLCNSAAPIHTHGVQAPCQKSGRSNESRYRSHVSFNVGTVHFETRGRTTPRLPVLPKADCRVAWRTSREPNSEQLPPTRLSYVQGSLAGSAHESDQWWDCTECFARQPPRVDVSPPTAHYA